MNYELRLGNSYKIGQELPWITDIKRRFNHFYLIGKTGVGKSTLMENMAKYDAEAGYSIFYIDPKGTHAVRLYNTLPKYRIIYVSKNNFDLVINPLRKDSLSLNDCISEFVQIMNIVVSLTSKNPEATQLHRQLLTNAILAFPEELRELYYLFRFLTYENERKAFLKNQKLPDWLREFWTEFDEREGRYHYHREWVQASERVSSRLNNFISDDRIKRLITGKNTLSFRDIIENGKIFLLNTAGMSFEQRAYITNLIVYGIFSYMEHEREKDGKPFFCYIDEFEICVSNLFSNLLALARSSKVGFTFAHHAFDQLPQNIVNSIKGIADNFVIYRCGEDEAKSMSSIFGIEARNFMNLPDYEAWARLKTDNIIFTAFKPFEASEELPSFKEKPNEGFSFLRDDWFSC